ncbi:hypothetical protein [Halomontanus rarus]|uniref:hypothetical protein n=1 Tax=Halomontanus rarus TaxID=3034020 RepID=UPI0023E76D22|nr:hypothetical protein [Halovivax sp. TS33]
MTDANPVSRRDSLKGIAAGTVLGSAMLGASSVSAGGDRDGGNGGDGEHDGKRKDDDRAEHGGIRLVPECTEPMVDLAVFRVDNETKRDVTLDWRVGEDDDDDGAITFVDCETVQIVGNFVDVFLTGAFVDEAGIGTLFNTVGSVNGERTINIKEEFGAIGLAGPITTRVELYEDESGPGSPDISRVHPEVERCGRELLAEAGLEPADVGAEDAPDDSDVTMPNGGTFTTAAKDSSYLFLRAPGGAVTVRLEREGKEIVRATSDTETTCREKIHGNVRIDDLLSVVGMLDDE